MIELIGLSQWTIEGSNLTLPIHHFALIQFIAVVIIFILIAKILNDSYSKRKNKSKKENEKENISKLFICSLMIFGFSIADRLAEESSQIIGEPINLALSIISGVLLVVIILGASEDKDEDKDEDDSIGNETKLGR